MITHERHHRKEELKKPSEWDALERDGMRICDPDGWRSPNFLHWDTPITHSEFVRRRMQCTMVPDCHDPDHFCTSHKVIHDGHCAECVAEQNEAMWDGYKCRVD